MAHLWLATGNRKKRAEMERLLGGMRLPDGSGLMLHTVDELGAPFEVAETEPDFRGNARLKAAALAQLTGTVALADDSGLSVDALHGRPGVLSARYGGPGLDDRGRLLRLLQELEQVPDGKRTARFTCSICLCGPDGTVRLAVEEHCEGLMLRAPQGAGGFGYDPAFVALEHAAAVPPRTFADLDPATKDTVSHRGKAMRRLLAALQADPSLLRA